MVALLCGVPLPALAQERRPPYDTPSDTVVYTTGDSAVVEAETRQEGHAEPAKAAAPANAAAKRHRCRLQAIETEPQFEGDLGIQHPPELIPYWLVCNDQPNTDRIVWRQVKVRGTPSSEPAPPAYIAARLRDEIPMPTARIRINPDLGLVGTESWFWLEGYSGKSIDKSTDAFGTPVEVQAEVSRYEWSFGDGTTVTSRSPGAPYPAPSGIRHVFQRASPRLDGYLVMVRFVFAVRYRVGQGTWAELPGIVRTASARYRVQESQAVLVQ